MEIPPYLCYLNQTKMIYASYKNQWCVKKFMKTLIYLVGLFLLISCNTDPNLTDYVTVTIPKTEYNKLKGIPEPPKPEYPKEVNFTGLGANAVGHMIEIDGCEYIINPTYGGNNSVLTHKGNCKFCQQRLEQTIRKIIQEESKKD